MLIDSALDNEELNEHLKYLKKLISVKEMLKLRGKKDILLEETIRETAKEFECCWSQLTTLNLAYNPKLEELYHDYI